MHIYLDESGDTGFKFGESHRDQLLQVADVVADAVAHAYEREDPAIRVLIEGLLTVQEQP